MSHSKHYRSFHGQFYGPDDPTNSIRVVNYVKANPTRLRDDTRWHYDYETKSIIT